MKVLNYVLDKLKLIALVGIGFVLLGLYCYVMTPSQVDTGYMCNEHSLRKMSSGETTSTTASGAFFLFVGGFNASSETQTLVKFSWKSNYDTYIMSSLPLESFRVKINNNVAVPTISFVPTKSCETYDNMANLDVEKFVLENCLKYAIVTVKDGDWPIQDDLPLNQPPPK